MKKDKGKENLINVLTVALVMGIFILSSGILLVGKHIPYGNLVLIAGSAIVYVSIILITWKI